MQFIKIWILRYKLAQLFKRAEQAFNLGRQAGDATYADLYSQAVKLINVYRVDYPHFKTDIEVPALADLEKLTIKPEPISIKAKAIQGIILAYAVGIGIGSLAAAVAGTYHVWMHLFHLIGG